MRATERRRRRRARVAALGLAPAFGSAETPVAAVDITRALGALQAQDYASGSWSIGVRSGLSALQVEQAVVDRQIVRTWPMRGTIHFVAAEDARWMSWLLARRTLDGLGARYRQLGIDEAQIERTGALLSEHLHTPVSRPDLADLLREGGIDPSGQRGYHLVGHHCMTGLVCQGPLEGKQPTFVLIDDWVAASLDPSREVAMALVIERYVRSHGPVTEKDIAGWIAGTLGFVREALGLLGDRIVRESGPDGEWLTHVDAPAATGATGVHLLPQWDEFLLGYKTREVSLPAEHLDKVVPGRNMVFRPTLVVDGEVAGTWTRALGDAKRPTRLTVTPFRALSARVRVGVERAAVDYGRFLGTEVDVQLAEA